MANEKILVVDDDANICELLRLYLNKEGYQVTIPTTVTVKSGENKGELEVNAKLKQYLSLIHI